MFDLGQLPVSGSFILSCALYAGASIVAGQVIGARTVERSDWPMICETSIRADVQAQIDARRREAQIVPETDCENLIGRWF